MRGASAIQTILTDSLKADVQVFAIWEPMLFSDISRPGGGVLARISDSRAAQFWDKHHLFAQQLKRDLESDPRSPRPQCCDDDGIIWDAVFVYPRAARWENSLPRSVFADGPVWRSKQLESFVQKTLTDELTRPH